ncbi:MAG: hypothetical protein U1E93_01915 [Alphaproteobacteria bacterium]
MDEPVLKNIWDADVPAHDSRFVVGVLARAEQRRFRREVLTITGLAAVAALLLALVMPAMEVTWAHVLHELNNLAILGLLAAITFALPQLLPARD